MEKNDGLFLGALVIGVPAFESHDVSSLSESERYSLLVSGIAPRPIALVSTVDSTGVRNLAPFSFFAPGGAEPMSLVLSVTSRPEGEKDTLRNIRYSGEFVVNSVTRSISKAMNQASIALGPSHTEWPLTALTPLPSIAVAPDRVAESPIQFECVLHQVVSHGSANYIIGQVVYVHFKSDWKNLSELRLLARMGGAKYLDSETGEIFEMARPLAPGS